MRHSRPNDAVRLEKLRADSSGLDMQSWSRALRQLPMGTVSEAEFLAWLEGPLRRVFPFDRFYGAYGSLAGGRVQVRNALSSGHGAEFLASRQNSFDVKARGCVEWWITHRRPVMLDKTGAMDALRTRISATERELNDVERFSLGVVVSYGVIDPFAGTGTYMGFSGVPKDHREKTLVAIELIAPVVHSLYFRTREIAQSAVELTALTDRQRDLVELAAQGLSDKEIAPRLGISHNTVGNHFSAIYAKLGISKRSQLIALLKNFPLV
jgi:DNA-binding CsgD family transcriptional regulator